MVVECVLGNGLVGTLEKRHESTMQPTQTSAPQVRGKLKRPTFLAAWIQDPIMRCVQVRAYTPLRFGSGLAHDTVNSVSAIHA